MAANLRWRLRFLERMNGFNGLLGLQPFAPEGDAASLQKLSFKFALPNAVFTASHLLDRPKHFTLQCDFMSAPSGKKAPVHLKSALIANSVLARDHASMLTLDPQTQMLCFNLLQSLDHEFDPKAMFAALHRVDSNVQQIRDLAPKEKRSREHS